METPSIQLMSQSFDFKIEVNESEIYCINISNSSNSLLINITKENCFPKIEYSKDFSLKELYQNSKFFKVFDDSKSIIEALKETFDSKKPRIEEENECIKLTIIPTFLALGESNLIIPKKNKDDKSIISELCNIVNKQGKEIESLKHKLTQLEEKFKKYEENPNIRKIKNANNIIGDIIKTEEQFNLICDWINREKSLKFKLLYKGTLDGDTYDVFHNKCDNQGANISIILSEDEEIFGGYTSKSWDKNNSYDIPDPNSFLFNINKRKKYVVSNDRGLMSSKYICDFGGNNFHELWLANNYLSNKSNCDNGIGYNFKNYEISGGKSTFLVKELEVYKVEED